MNLKELFGRKKLPTATVFVDFEHWCISLSKLYNTRPIIKKQYEELAKQYNIEKVLFFGDFSNPVLRNEMDNIREVTNSIIDTQNPSDHLQKDYTDFIMLDYIYQESDNKKSADTYILFTGDGHFSSVVRYLQIRKKKKVAVYGVRGAVSNKLKSIADICIELPTLDDEHNRFYGMIIDNFNYLATKRGKAVYPTFKTTIATVSERNGVSHDDIQTALQELITRGIIYRADARVEFNKTIKILKVDWQKATRAALWSPDRA